MKIRWNIIVHSFLSLFVPLVLTLVAWFFHDILIPSNVLLIYLLGVFFVAILSSVLASLISAATFKFFFSPPIFSLKIADFDNLMGLVIMLIVGTVTSKLTENLRVKSKLIENKERKASALYGLSKALAESRSEKEIIHVAVHHIYAEFKSLNTFLFPDRQRLVHYPDESPLNISLQTVNLNVANWAFQHGQIAGKDTANSPNESCVYIPL